MEMASILKVMQMQIL